MSADGEVSLWGDVELGAQQLAPLARCCNPVCSADHVGDDVVLPLCCPLCRRPRVQAMWSVRDRCVVLTCAAGCGQLGTVGRRLS